MSERAKEFLNKYNSMMQVDNPTIWYDRKTVLKALVDFHKECQPTDAEIEIEFQNTRHSYSGFDKMTKRKNGAKWCRDFVREEPKGEILQCFLCKHSELYMGTEPCDSCNPIHNHWEPKEPNTCLNCKHLDIDAYPCTQCKDYYRWEKVVCKRCNGEGWIVEPILTYPCPVCNDPTFNERNPKEPQSEIEKLESQIHEILKSCDTADTLEEVLNKVDEVVKKPKTEKWKEYGFPTIEEWVDSLHESMVDCFKQLDELKKKIKK